jgi:hypothetical protein
VRGKPATKASSFIAWAEFLLRLLLRGKFNLT